MGKTRSAKSKIRYVSDEKGEVIAVQIEILHFQKLLNEINDLKHDDSMEDAIREIYEIEKGTLPKVALHAFLDEIQ